jgi:hypothetical protein
MLKQLFFTILMFYASKFLSQVDTTDVRDLQNDTLQNKFDLPIFSTSGADAESEMEQQDASSLLQSSRDVYAQFSSFHFNIAKHRLRGYQAENNLVMINGISVNNLESGFSNWSSWGGLNDVTRFTENRIGIVACRSNYSGVGGYTLIDSKSSSFKKGTRISYTNSNRIYAHRVMLTHSTGMMRNGWALTLSASSRQGNEVYVPGTYFSANAFYLSLDKQINDKHLFSFTSFYAPIEQGRNSYEVREAFNLAGTNYYNSNWGLQNGRVRNASVSTNNRPTFMLAHQFNINTASKFTTSILYSFGKNGLTGLNWNNSPNPRPNYYRYLPSYFYGINETELGDAQKQLWLTDINARQINWDRLIAMNKANIANLPGTNSINSSESRSRYVLENRLQALKNLALNVVYNARVKNIFMSAGLNGNLYSNNYYKQMEDLLGGTFWLDVDQFALNQGVDENFASNNLDDPNKPIRVGDKFGYDYTIHIHRAETWGQLEYSTNKLDIYSAVSLSRSQIWRSSKLVNGKFPNDSKGIGEKLDFVNYGIKGGITYKISGRHFITTNGIYLTRTPEVNSIYYSAQTRNSIIPTIKNELVMGMDVNYLIKYPNLKLRATYYNTQINNQIYSRIYFHDVYNTLVNYIMTDVNQNFQGIELGIEKILFTSHTIQAAFGIGNYIYTNRPKATAIKNNSNENLFDARTAYLKNYKVGGAPQSVAGISYRYSGKKFWNAGFTFNFFDNNYIEPNPDRRTAEALDKYTETDPQYAQIVNQEKLPNNYTMDLSAGKSFRVKRNNYLNVNISITNVLNNKNFIVGGFEQLRWDQTLPDRFPNKYAYAFGTTYIATVNFSF